MLQSERRFWTADEDQLLREAVDRENPGNPTPSGWHAICKHVPNRTPSECRIRCFKKLDSGGWSPEQDVQLIHAMAKYGTCWSVVATCVNNRNSYQCAKRFTDFRLVSTSWTPEQDTILINAVNEYGKLRTRAYFLSRTGLSAKRRYYHLIAGEDGMRERCDEITPHDDDPLDSISAGKSRGVLELPECPDHLSSTFECVDDGPPNENKGSTPPSLPTRLISNDISSAFHPTAIHGDQANTHHTTTTHSTNSHNTTTTNSSNSHNTTHTNNMNSHNINITNHYHSHHKTKPKRSRWSVTTFVYNITNIIQPVPWLPSYCYNLGFSSWIPNYWSWFSSAWGNHHRFWNRYGWH